MQTDDSLSRSSGAKQTVNVLSKALDVLEQLIWNRPMTLGELATASGVERAAVYRILNTLTERDYVAQERDTRRYLPGSRLRAAATVLSQDSDPTEFAMPYLVELGEEFGETVNLGALVGDQVHYLAIIESSHPLRMSSSLDARDPAHATALGKAILSRFDRPTLDRMFARKEFEPRTTHTIGSYDDLVADLGACAVRGFAIDDEENEIGAICIAAPIDLGADTRYAISISAPAARVERGDIDRVGHRLHDVAEKIAKRYAGLVDA